MSNSKFKTLRHIETVRNYLAAIIKELMYRQEQHDQTKLQPPEAEIFEKYMPLFEGVKYGSEKYREVIEKLKPAVDHHNKHNRHHPEHFKRTYECGKCNNKYDYAPDKCECGHGIFSVYGGLINGMNLIDLIEMMCDWKAAGLRRGDGDIYKSIEISKGRFGISDQLEQILINTAELINSFEVYHKAEES